MNKVKIRLLLSIILATLFCLVSVSEEKKEERPNIILMMADDLGWRDLSCFGNDRVSTPNIDRIANSGILLNQFYAASAVCTPTRVSVLSGKYPLRFNVRKHFTDNGEYLPICNSLPRLLKAEGYTTAHIGKWHLGGVREQDLSNRPHVPGPVQHGFQYYLTQLEQQPLRGEMGAQKILFNKGGTCLLRNEEKVGADDPFYNMYLTDVFGQETINRIVEYQGSKNPFFINLWWLAPHKPYEAAPEPHWSQTAADSISDDQHKFRSMVARMDFQVGRILDKIKELGIEENTLILFVSDNGGAFEANIGELKGGKTDLHEGGIRVPFLASWPNHIASGIRSDILGHSTDLLPTICGVAGITLPENDRFDGIDLMPLLTGKDGLNPRGTTFWQIDLYKMMQRHYAKPKPYATEIARNGKWKMMALEGEPVELFDVENDIEEKYNLIYQEPEIVEGLKQELLQWLSERRINYGRSDDL